MAENIYTVEQLLELALRFKALRIKTGPLEIELSPQAFEPTPAPAVQDAEPPDFERVPTPEEFLYMSGLQVAPEEDVPEGQ